jgi:hypothetical protein
MGRLGLLVTGVLMVTSSAHAQDTSRGEFSVGWRFYHAAISSFIRPLDPALATNDYPKGWYADVALNLSPKFAIVGEVGGTYHRDEITQEFGFSSSEESSEATFHTFMGGVRVRAPQNAAFVPFGQVLFGGEHDSSADERTTRFTFTPNPSTIARESSTSSPVLALDAGVTAAAGWLGVRASVGYVRFFTDADADALRVNVGAAFRF